MSEQKPSADDEQRTLAIAEKLIEHAGSLEEARELIEALAELQRAG